MEPTSPRTELAVPAEDPSELQAPAAPRARRIGLLVVLTLLVVLGLALMGSVALGSVQTHHVVY